jgi:hypothetical protein
MRTMNSKSNDDRWTVGATPIAEGVVVLPEKRQAHGIGVHHETNARARKECLSALVVL